MVGSELISLSARVEASLRVTVPDATVEDLRVLAGGRSSLTYLARARSATAIDEIVVKVAPAGVPPTHNRDVLRQAKVLQHLENAARVPVPQVLTAVEAVDLDTPPFFVMRFVEGDAFEPIVDPPGADVSPNDVSGRLLAAVDVLAALSAPGVIEGLSTDPPSTLADELAYWTKAFSTVPDEFSVGADKVADLLGSQMPDPIGAALVHGDFRLGNLLCSGPHVRAIIDWEIWSIGDPRIDVGWLLMFTAKSKIPCIAVRDVSGMPNDIEILQRLRRVRTELCADIEWFEAMARWRMAAIHGLLVKQAVQLGVRPPEGFGESVAPLISAAREMLS